MLEYRRSARSEAELATNAAGPKRRPTMRHWAVLMDLLNKRPSLRSIVFDQLIPKLDEKCECQTSGAAVASGAGFQRRRVVGRAKGRRRIRSKGGSTRSGSCPGNHPPRRSERDR